MPRFHRPLILFCLVALLALGCRTKPGPSDAGGQGGGTAAASNELPEASGPVAAGAKGKYTLAVSIYAGWMPWYYAKEEGIVNRWAEKEGIEIEVVYMDYIASVEAFVAGKADACVMTNMEALDMPAASGIDTTAIIMGDYSNGNDKILVRDIADVAGLKGQEISLVELSVSDYLLNRALEGAGLSQQDVQLVNTSDSDIGPAFIANTSQKAVVTWNPIAMEIEKQQGVKSIFDSSKIPGEILDLCVVNTQVLRDDPRLGRALVGTWYEVLGAMRGDQADAALEAMAKLAGCSLDDYKAQLQTTAMFWTSSEAVDYTKSAELKEKMDTVRNFCFKKGLLGKDAKSADHVGIQYPDRSVVGDGQNVKLRFATSFMEASAK